MELLFCLIRETLSNKKTFEQTEENEGKEKKVNHVISGERVFQAKGTQVKESLSRMLSMFKEKH